ncbi:XRE family transcriptional regulator [Bowmanella yangjiangensis]|uniref:Helix-turn-helix transcriptional regulator n=1 Tax=Bowmanella yangjiangensis TaxID=2811230 RepID=A0ABS3D0I2_9ALTE|nr:S24 family peptidase [Bowmanella yangjiangensis]MBN7822315.1 helix-turn-helix transcriptional regulator [Bowmanella yangjiangensis]
MKSLADRIKAARKHADLTQKDLAAKAGVSQPVISQLEKGENLQSVHLVKIASACNVRAEWLATGQGEMTDGSNSVAEVIGTYSSGAAAKVMEMLSKHGKSLRPDQQERLERAVADTLNDKPDATPPDNVIVADFSRRPLVGDEIRIAHYDVQGAMGNGKLVHDFPEMFRDVTVSQQHLRELGVTYKDPVHLKLITGIGQSMAPTIQDKDPLIVDASVREFTGDGIYAFIWQGHFYIKSLQVVDAEHFKMISKAEKLYPPVEIRIDETYIQARVLLVWNAQKL